MERSTEPELMEDAEQAQAYADADFSDAHNHLLSIFGELFGIAEVAGTILDLGCGPGDVVARFLAKYPSCSVVGVDGSEAMLAIAADRIDNDSALRGRAQFVCALIPSADIPKRQYAAIVCTGTLHHFHDPLLFWEQVRELAQNETAIFVWDLRRPESVAAAATIVEKYAKAAHPVLKRDFKNSLLAAFTKEELQAQIANAGLEELEVREIGDRGSARRCIRPTRLVLTIGCSYYQLATDR